MNTCDNKRFLLWFLITLQQITLFKVSKEMIMTQWRIADFPEEGAPTYYFGKFFQKATWKWKNLTQRGRIPNAPSGPPMLIGAEKRTIFALVLYTLEQLSTYSFVLCCRSTFSCQISPFWEEKGKMHLKTPENSILSQIKNKSHSSMFQKFHSCFLKKITCIFTFSNTKD